MLKALFNRIKSWLPTLSGVVGAFVIAAGWNWYHLKHRPHTRFILITLLTWVTVYVGYRTFKWTYHFLTVKFNRHIFWQQEFGKFLDSLFFIISLFFLILFSRWELVSVAGVLLLMAVLFWRTQAYLSHHPNAHEWKMVNKNIFTLIFFLFALFSVFQYSAYSFANFDPYLKVYNIVMFRAWAMTMFWVFGFVVATLIYWKIKGPLRYVLISLWAILFLILVLLWIINVGIMYFSGLYISPLMMGLVEGSSGVVFNWLTGMLVAGGILAFIIFGLIFRQVIGAYKRSSFRQWTYYSLALMAIAILSIFGLSSFKNTPEYLITRSFYQSWRGDTKQVELSPIIKEKLERFGMHYNTDNFKLAHKDKVFNSTTAKTILPAKFANSKPNIIIIFLESFSARLTSVYNSADFPGLTPSLEQMAADSHTTVFKNFYNGATPTINGILSQLCSFLPPTGYTEIDKNRGLQNLHLLCLPKILNSNGYKSNTYIQAVDRHFENKDKIFPSMGTSEIYGSGELKAILKTDPLSWGYSDHQMFPVMWDMIQKKPEPFLMMLSTIDSHPPFDIAKDVVPYKDGGNDVLNSFHTTDDAFGKFWNEFKQSKYYDNTIVVAVADHAAFPGTAIKKLFPEEADSLSFYDQNMFMMYLPGVVTTVIPSEAVTDEGSIPKNINTFSSGIDIAPTLLQILNINVQNSFEGRSIFDDRNKYPNLLGMHEFGLYINQTNDKDPDSAKASTGKRDTRYEVPTNITCDQTDYSVTSSEPLTLCEYLDFYKWKRQMFEQGRFWEE